MGERKARLEAFGDKAKPISEFVNLYQHSLRALIASLPEHHKIVAAKKDITTVGMSEIWPCRDGAVVLIHSSQSTDIKVIVRDPLNTSVNDFLREGKAVAFCDARGNSLSFSAAIEVEDATRAVIHFAGLTIKSEEKVYRPNYGRGMILGWEAQLPRPDKLALDDFRSVFVTRNVGGSEAEKLPYGEGKKIVAASTAILIREFTALLARAEKEEELQAFLSDHPELIYPDFIECFPKLRLGEDFVTDYVFLVQGLGGSEYVFVEIEPAANEIFTKQGQFSAAFTKAKDQILEWDKWLTQNHAYISRKLPNLFKPRFHIVMGRNASLTEEHREKLKAEFHSTSRCFTTYDDIVDRFQQITKHLAGAF